MKGDFVGNLLGPNKLGENKFQFVASDDRGKLIDLSESNVLWKKGFDTEKVHSIQFFHYNQNFRRKWTNSEINIYEVVFIGNDY